MTYSAPAGEDKFLWHNPAVGRVKHTRQMNYWVTAGDTPAEVVRHYAEATGVPPVTPEWALGYWPSKPRTNTESHGHAFLWYNL